MSCTILPQSTQICRRQQHSSSQVSAAAPQQHAVVAQLAATQRFATGSTCGPAAAPSDAAGLPSVCPSQQQLLHLLMQSAAFIASIAHDPHPRHGTTTLHAGANATPGPPAAVPAVPSGAAPAAAPLQRCTSQHGSKRRKQQPARRRTFSARLRCSICSTSLLLPASSSAALVGSPPVFCRLAMAWIWRSTSAFCVRICTSSSVSWRLRATCQCRAGGGKGVQ